MTAGKLKKDDVLHLAKLSNLNIVDAEVETLTKQLDETLSYVENLKDVTTTHDELASSSVQIKTNPGFEDGTSNSRQITQEEALRNSKHTKNKFFVVSRII